MKAAKNISWHPSHRRHIKQKRHVKTKQTLIKVWDLRASPATHRRHTIGSPWNELEYPWDTHPVFYSNTFQLYHNLFINTPRNSINISLVLQQIQTCSNIFQLIPSYSNLQFNLNSKVLQLIPPIRRQMLLIFLQSSNRCHSYSNIFRPMAFRQTP